MSDDHLVPTVIDGRNFSARAVFVREGKTAMKTIGLLFVVLGVALFVGNPLFWLGHGVFGLAGSLFGLVLGLAGGLVGLAVGLVGGVFGTAVGVLGALFGIGVALVTLAVPLLVIVVLAIGVMKLVALA